MIGNFFFEFIISFFYIGFFIEIITAPVVIMLKNTKKSLIVYVQDVEAKKMFLMTKQIIG